MGPRWAALGYPPTDPGSLTQSLAVTRRRCRWLYRHHPMLAQGVETLVSYMVGWGLVPRSLHPDPGVRQELEALWADWASQVRVDTLQRDAVRETLVAGEAFVRLRPRYPDDRDALGRQLLVPLELELLAPEYVPQESRVLEGGRRLREGIEFDALGRRTAYWIYTRHPDDMVDVRPLETVQVPAGVVAHLVEVEQVGQVRGVPRLARVLTRVQDLETYTDATLRRQVVGTLFAGFIRRPTSTDAGALGETVGSDGVGELGMMPGDLYYLGEGEEIEFARPPEVGDYDAFVRAIAQDIAAGIGVTYEQLTGDLSRVNYSSIRAGLIGFRRRIEAWVYTVLVPRLLDPIWIGFLRAATLAGVLRVPGVAEGAYRATRVEWLTQGWEWVDPQREIGAAMDAVRAGFATRSQVVSERGYVAQDLERERAAELARARALGVEYTTDVPAPDDRGTPREGDGGEDEDAGGSAADGRQRRLAVIRRSAP